VPTARGWGLAAGTVLGFVAGWWLGYPELSTVASAGLAALVLGRILLLRKVSLDVSRDVAPVRVTRGDPAVGVVSATNTGRWRSRPVRAADRIDGEPVTVDLPRLAPHAAHTASYLLPTRRRGEVGVGPLQITASDPFGLFRVVRSYGGARTLLVAPRTVALDPLPSGNAANVEGPASQTAPSGTVTFHALREYVFGDDLRHIHWRTTARTNTLMVRQLVDSSLPRTTVLLDTRERAYPGEEEFELAVDIAASVALAAARAGFPVTVVDPVRQVFAADGGRADAGGLLERLALVTRTGSGDLAATAGALRPGPGGGSLTVVTSGIGAAELDEVAAARGRFDRVVLVRTGVGLAALPETLAGNGIDAADLAGFAAAWRAR
jgi:uncharacterized protein (DUF58 family)